MSRLLLDRPWQAQGASDTPKFPKSVSKILLFPRLEFRSSVPAAETSKLPPRLLRQFVTPPIDSVPDLSRNSPVVMEVSEWTADPFFVF
jgi:hypothetical protein